MWKGCDGCRAELALCELKFCFGGEPKRTSGASQAAELMSVAQDGSDKPVSVWVKSGFAGAV